VEGVTEGLSGGLMHTAATSPEVVVLFQDDENEYRLKEKVKAASTGELPLAFDSEFDRKDMTCQMRLVSSFVVSIWTAWGSEVEVCISSDGHDR
jgi:hypothetical protein